MEIVLALLIVVSISALVISLSEAEYVNAFAVGVITFFFSTALYGLSTSTKTEYICPTRLSETVGVYHNGKETIVIPPHYNLDETVIEKRYNPLPVSMQVDSYTIMYDINGVCK
jgi:hypothetical protein